MRRPRLHEVIKMFDAGAHITTQEAEFALHQVSIANVVIKALGPEFDLARHRLIHYENGFTDILDRRKAMGYKDG